MNTMSAPSLPFTVEGSDADGGAVLFNDLRAFMKALADCLTLVEKRTLGTAELRHRIADMQSSSAHMTLEPAPRKKAAQSDSGRVVYETFEKTVANLEAGRDIDSRFGQEDLKEFRKLAQLTLGGKKKVQVAGTQITTQFVANIDKLLGGTTKSKGSVKGRVEKLNVHDRHEFSLYPPIGGCVVTCTFDEDKFAQVQQAIKQNVTVHGTLTYRGDNPYPERVQVDFIDVHPADDTLPKLSEMGGTLTSSDFGGMGSVEFVRKIRDNNNGD
jgi:hypothetical protein